MSVYTGFSTSPQFGNLLTRNRKIELSRIILSNIEVNVSQFVSSESYADSIGESIKNNAIINKELDQFKKLKSNGETYYEIPIDNSTYNETGSVKINSIGLYAYDGENEIIVGVSIPYSSKSYLTIYPNTFMTQHFHLIIDTKDVLDKKTNYIFWDSSEHNVDQNSHPFNLSRFISKELVYYTQKVRPGNYFVGAIIDFKKYSLFGNTKFKWIFWDGVEKEGIFVYHKVPDDAQTDQVLEVKCYASLNGSEVKSPMRNLKFRIGSKGSIVPVYFEKPPTCPKEGETYQLDYLFYSDALENVNKHMNLYMNTSFSNIHVKNKTETTFDLEICWSDKDPDDYPYDAELTYYWTYDGNDSDIDTYHIFITQSFHVENPASDNKLFVWQKASDREKTLTITDFVPENRIIVLNDKPDTTKGINTLDTNKEANYQTSSSSKYFTILGYKKDNEGNYHVVANGFGDLYVINAKFDKNNNVISETGVKITNVASWYPGGVLVDDDYAIVTGWGNLSQTSGSSSYPKHGYLKIENSTYQLIKCNNDDYLPSFEDGTIEQPRLVSDILKLGNGNIVKVDMIGYNGTEFRLYNLNLASTYYYTTTFTFIIPFHGANLSLRLKKADYDDGFFYLLTNDTLMRISEYDYTVGEYVKFNLGDNKKIVSFHPVSKDLIYLLVAEKDGFSVIKYTIVAFNMYDNSFNQRVSNIYDADSFPYTDLKMHNGYLYLSCVKSGADEANDGYINYASIIQLSRLLDLTYSSSEVYVHSYNGSILTVNSSGTINPSTGNIGLSSYTTYVSCLNQKGTISGLTTKIINI